jgi:hypothetical protein
MNLSRERLLAQAALTGFRPEVLEKVLRLVSLLNALSTSPLVGNRIALKGGTALNLRTRRIHGPASPHRIYRWKAGPAVSLRIGFYW